MYLTHHVHDDVDLAVGLLCLGDHPFDVVFLHGIALKSGALVTARRQEFDGVIGGAMVDIGDDHFGAFPGHEMGDGAARIGATPEDDGDLVCKPVHFRPLFPLFSKFSSRLFADPA